MSIPQTYIGKISVVGDAFCYGAALHQQIPVYLDIAGSATSVEAVWAKLANGQEARITPPSNSSHPEIILQPVEKGTLQRLQRKIEGLSLHHLLLLHKSMMTPCYAETGFTHLIITEPQQASAMLGHHILQLTQIAVYPEWYNYLVKRGRESGLLVKCQCYGGIQVFTLHLDRTAWEGLITTGLNLKAIHLPREGVPD